MIDLGTAPRQDVHGNPDPNQGSAEAIIEQLKAKMQGRETKGVIDLGEAPEQDSDRRRRQLAPDPAEGFRAAMSASGLEPPVHIDTSGAMVRFDIDAKGDKVGWYVFHADGVPAGQFGNWKTGLSEKWCSKDPQAMTEAEQAEHHRFNERAKAQRAAQLLADQEQAATKAWQRWDLYHPADTGHPYLVEKRLTVHGIRQDGNKLLVDMRDEAGRIWALQTIGADGSKLFQPKGCRTKGLFHQIGNQPAPGGCIGIAEGWATSAAIHAATGHPVAVAFSASNMEHIARIVKGLTVPYLARDPRKADDVDTRGPDHADDACRYGCLHQKYTAHTRSAW